MNLFKIHLTIKLVIESRMFKIIFSLVPRIKIATIITLQRSFQKIPEKKY